MATWKCMFEWRRGNVCLNGDMGQRAQGLPPGLLNIIWSTLFRAVYFVFGGAIVLVGLDNFCFLLRKGYAATKTHISRNSGAAPRESRDCCAPCLALTGRYGPAHTRAAPRTLREGARRGCPQDVKGGRTQGLPPGR